MYFPQTMAVLGVLTAAILVLRVFWWRLPERAQSLLLSLAAVCAILPAVTMVTRWSITSTRANTLVNWIAIAGYELILLRFSLVRPQWLTSFCSIVLLLPVFAASTLFPLTQIFHPKDTELFRIGGPYLCERSPWQTSGGETPGFDVRVYYQPRFVPFLKHGLQRSAFNAEECEAAQSTALIVQGSRKVLFHCPAKPGQGAVDHILPLN